MIPPKRSLKRRPELQTIIDAMEKNYKILDKRDDYVLFYITYERIDVMYQLKKVDRLIQLWGPHHGESL